MREGSLLIIKGPEVISLLARRESELVGVVEDAYLTHAAGKTSLPHSTFLSFPENEDNRIIALPSYLGGKFDVAGLKWIGSFPRNIHAGQDRASAVMILNSPSNGRPEALLEASVISAKRTAASAALAARKLRSGRRTNQAGIIGCGLINMEVARFLQAVFAEMETLWIFDIDSTRAAHFKRKCQENFPGLKIEIARCAQEILGLSLLVSIATTALNPHIFSVDNCLPGTVILHVSLRDFSPEVIMSCNNIVDDIDHVCRAKTSVHLASELTGHRNFIQGALGDVLTGECSLEGVAEGVTIFSPFGLGILDLAVGKFVLRLAADQGRGETISSFLPQPWAAPNNEA
jgi:N-[(2S)-2-amino-2-carboxyethyl]-L-glutamate dehydrogenase